MSQFDVVAQWIAARGTDGVPFVVLGDFNRGLDKQDPFIRKIVGTAPLTAPPRGSAARAGATSRSSITS